MHMCHLDKKHFLLSCGFGSEQFEEEDQTITEDATGLYHYYLVGRMQEKGIQNMWAISPSKSGQVIQVGEKGEPN